MNDKTVYPFSHYERNFNTPGFIMRPMFLHVKEKLGSDVTGAEVGIYLGENAEYVLRNLNPRKYYMIDAYEAEVGGKSFEQQTAIYNWISGIFEKRDNVVFIRDRSLDASYCFMDGELDFVYLDDDHKRDNISKELELWYPKVKSGGVFGGHDYGEELDRSWCDVKEVVDSWAKEKALKVYAERGLPCHGNICDWWVNV